jgi:hypothetical protein
MIRNLTVKGIKYGFRLNGCRAVLTVLLFVLPVMLSSCGRSTSADSAGAGAVKESLVDEARGAILGADAAMGDWKGSWQVSGGGDSGPLVAQVIALGKGQPAGAGAGQYRAKCLEEFDTPSEPLGVLDGERQGDVVSFAGRAKYENSAFDVKAAIKGDKLTGTFEGPDASGTFALEHVFRVSPTMGAKPPKGAVRLFNGKDFKDWKTADKKEGEDQVKWELVDKAMRVKPGTGSIITKKQFTDVVLHIEFRSPFMPDARGQGRGNSGVYLQGRYEVQVLDSYGLEGLDNECGGIYTVKAPLVNMCAPPGQWQTYDITFSAPRFDGAGKMVSNPTLTVLHNGVLIQDKTQAKGPTTASLGGKATEPGPLYLQDHGNTVEYRNIWLIER